VLEAELRRNICFSYHVVRNLSRQTPVRLRPLDRFEMAVRLRNDSDLKLLGVRGMISPTALASFKACSFKVDSLEPRTDCEIARFTATLVDVPANLELVLQQVAVVSYTVRADLTTFTFADLDRPLLYSPDPSRMATSITKPVSRPTVKPRERSETPRRRMASRFWPVI
jgi:hypothetical protein